jgi:hypothetical protein
MTSSISQANREKRRMVLSMTSFSFIGNLQVALADINVMLFSIVNSNGTFCCVR